MISPPALLSLLLALTVHECSHAWAADRLGDPTPRLDGRLTLNPLAHLDLTGTIVFLLSMLGGIPFGWAKPVPVDTRYFRHPKRDLALVALAGPASNLVLAIAAAIGCALLTSDFNLNTLYLAASGQAGTSILVRLGTQLLSTSILVNLGIMAFNLLPIFPLDGSKILHAFVPLRWEETYLTLAEHGVQILIIVMLIDGFIFPILSFWLILIQGPILALLLAFL